VSGSRRKPTPMPTFDTGGGSIIDRAIPKPGSPEPEPGSPTPPAPPPPTARPASHLGVKLDQDLADAVRNAVLWLRSHGHPTATLTGYVEHAVREQLRRDTAALNDGKPFPPAGGRLPAGRPITGSR
jgi:hypothetical protein